MNFRNLTPDSERTHTGTLGTDLTFPQTSLYHAEPAGQSWAVKPAQNQGLNCSAIIGSDFWKTECGFGKRTSENLGNRSAPCRTGGSNFMSQTVQKSTSGKPIGRTHGPQQIAHFRDTWRHADSPFLRTRGGARIAYFRDTWRHADSSFRGTRGGTRIAHFRDTWRHADSLFRGTRGST